MVERDIEALCGYRGIMYWTHVAARGSTIAATFGVRYVNPRKTAHGGATGVRESRR
jgi:hypothetical protein